VREDIIQGSNSGALIANTISGVRGVRYILICFMVGLGVTGIVVDGLPDDWGATSPVIVDPWEDEIPPSYNIWNVFASDDGVNLYFRVDVYGQSTWVGESGPFVYYEIYIDADQNPSTGVEAFGLGADYKVTAYNIGTYIWAASDGSWNYIGNGLSAQDATTEIAAAISYFGLSSSDTIDLVAFLDNASAWVDDSTPIGSYTIIPEPTTLLSLLAGIPFLRRKRKA